MGKKKDGARKAKVIPKRIAGVKLPKELRRQGEALIERVTSAEGQASLARGLTMAAGLAQLAAARTRTAAPRPEAAANDAAAAPVPPLDPAKVADAVGTVAEVVLGRLFKKG